MKVADLDAVTRENIARGLSPADRQRLERMPAAAARREFLAGRGLLCAALSASTGAEAVPVWRFREQPLGKPVLDHPVWGDRLQFNLSHSGGLVACAVACAPVGVDLERSDRRVDVAALAGRFFAPAETASLARLPPQQRRRRFLAHWTLKEAFLKARGVGLTVPLSSAAFELGDGQADPGPRLTAPGMDASGWHFHLHHHARFVLAVAVQAAPAQRPRFRQLPGGPLCRAAFSSLPALAPSPEVYP